jgi:rhodanese-related sulfurtransferase
MLALFRDHSSVGSRGNYKRRRVVNARETLEHAAGHAAGAVNHPLSRFNTAALPADRPLILICQAGSRFALALQQALRAASSNVVQSGGGTSGWQPRGGKLTRLGEKVHPRPLSLTERPAKDAPDGAPVRQDEGSLHNVITRALTAAHALSMVTNDETGVRLAAPMLCLS